MSLERVETRLPKGFDPKSFTAKQRVELIQNIRKEIAIINDQLQDGNDTRSHTKQLRWRAQAEHAKGVKLSQIHSLVLSLLDDYRSWGEGILEECELEADEKSARDEWCSIFHEVRQCA